MANHVVFEPPAISLRSLLRPSLHALRIHWPQFVLFQILALALVISYFNLALMRQFCSHLSDLKQQWGLAFSALAMAASGFLLPECAKLALGSKSRTPLALYGSSIIIFMGNGAITDLQYRLLGYCLGNDMMASTVIKKVIADQFIMTPIYGVPYWILVIAWRANHYNVRHTVSVISPRWYLSNVMPLLLPAWCFWIPMTAMIYSLPASLQFSLFALAMAAWSLIMLSVANSTPTVLPTPAIAARKAS